MKQKIAPRCAVVLISGRGSNLEAIVEAIDKQALPLRISAVISNRPDAAGLTYAQHAGLKTHVVDHTHYADRAAFDAALARLIDFYSPDVVVLAGFMRMLTPEFVNHYLGRLVNIHPSLLPAYKGLKTHERALHDKAKVHGASVHFVTPDLDGGPVLMQVRVPVQPNDTPQSLAARVLAAEHRLYPAALALIAAGRVEFAADGLRVDNAPLAAPVDLPYTVEDASIHTE